jgi:GTPase
MPLPVVAIVGRPNVGKSSLFNWLAGRRISIVDPTAGVTRDRVATPIEVNERYFELVDTGGMGIIDSDNLTEDVEKQITYAIESAAVILFVVDVREGVVPLDQIVAERLRGLDKKVIFLANKSDDPKLDIGTSDFFRLGYGEPLPVSANNGRNRDNLLELIEKNLPTENDGSVPTKEDIKIAVVGRRNAGKSTFINSLADEERVIVSEVAGTTRDSVDVHIERDGKSLLVIDTAGVRKKARLSNDIEYYSMHRAERSIRRADVVLHFMDARLRIGRVDKQLTEYILENHKPAIFVINKWDLVKHAIDMAKMVEYVRKVFRMLDFVPIAFVTAKHGKNATRLLHLARNLRKQSAERLSTGVLNRLVRDAMTTNPPPARMGNKQGKVYYVSQVATEPPSIAFVVNDPELFDDTYVRYLVKSIRENSPFYDVPIKIIMKPRGEGGRNKLDKEETADEVATNIAASAPKPVKKAKKKRTPKTWDV